MFFRNIITRSQVLSFHLKSVLNSFTHVRTNNRFLFCSSVNRLKEIQRTETDKSITVEGTYVESPRKNNLIKFEDPHPDSKCDICSLCRFGIQVKHTDVLILNQFVNSHGKAIPRKVTGLCKEQHKRVEYLLVMAQKAGLMPMYKDKKLQELSGWEAYNKYYDETVIDAFLIGRRNKA